MNRPIVAVVGTPNVGKSTLFNVLTGLQQKVGNFPGVTVEPMIGSVHYNTKHTTLIDLPGIYSLDPTSEDERLTVDVLRGTHPSIERPDAILLVMSASDPQKCLVLYSALAQLGLPISIAVTMVDTVKAHGGSFDDIGLMHELGANIFPVVGSKGLGVGDVINALVSIDTWRIPSPPVTIEATLEQRFAWASTVIDRHVRAGSPDVVSERLDNIFLHPVWGGVIFIAVMAFFFQSIFAWAEPLMGGIEWAFAELQTVLQSALPDNLFRSFLVKGVVGGVGSVIVFLPQILILNLLITVLEECGYLARAAFLVDRVMGLFGLQGRSFIPLLGSFACAIPGIMSARIIPSYKDRLATIMATPLMTCSARLPVYTLLIGAVIPSGYVLGVVSIKGAVMASLYIAGALSGLLIALFLKRTLFRGAVVPFLIEFPPYRIPSLKSVGITMVGRSKDFLKTAGTVILAFSIILWVLTEIPRAEIPDGVEGVQAEHLQIEQSMAATIGKTIQPVFAPLGFDWKITLGVLSSYAARETFVSAMGQIYAADVAESDEPLRVVLSKAMPLPVGLSVLAFYVYALQCISTMAIMRRETGTWKWPALAFAITLVLAYTASFVVYTAFSP
ncbi:MAG: ferrous iron transporter B [Ignavibacteriae bacterium]|nr:MAG: ferrous iron transporter B [Ignavibacteriota bacterium]